MGGPMLISRYFSIKQATRVSVFFVMLLSSCGKNFYDLVSRDPSSRFVYSEIESLFYSKNMKVNSFSKSEFDVKQETFYGYCKDYLLRDDIVGNPSLWESKESPWKISRGSPLLVSAYNQTKNHIPFVKRIHYKTVGKCQLGMRIFISDLNNLKTKKLKSFIFFHGGGWKYRNGTATVAVDVTVPNLTEKDYVVFAPVYRLVSNQSGPKECQNASGQDIIEDTVDAFRWVLKHQHEYGVGVKKLAVGGHSSGGYLAAFLLTYYPEHITKGLLLYPVTDLGFLLHELSEGGLYDNQLLDSRSAFYSFISLKVSHTGEKIFDQDLVKRSAFSKIIQENPSHYPKVFTLHGVHDEISPVEVSSRLCDAFDETKSVSDEKFLFTKTLQECGNSGSFLAVIRQARHMMDLKCLTPLISDIFPKYFLNELLCTVGDDVSERSLINALSVAYNKFL